MSCSVLIIANDQLRAIRLSENSSGLRLGLFTKCGDTQILCTVTVQPGVPKFLEAWAGWLTAEYRMLPAATPQRQEGNS